MSESALLAGAALRRLRRREGLTQVAMAARLGISPSYLNLIERNQRPLSARLVVQLAESFDFDPRSLRSDAVVGGADGLRRRLADERFADLAIDRDELSEWLAAAPQTALAFARLYDARSSGGAAAATAPEALVRSEIARWNGHYPDLDSAAEALADELRLSNPEPYAALTERLRGRHQLGVRVLPVEVMSDCLRRLDLHARQVQLSERLDSAARTFELAVQIAVLEQREAVGALADGAAFSDRTAWRLYRRHLFHSFAAAVLMPYSRFLRACEATGYDLPLLERRFGVGFEALAHRLTTLQRVGQRGLPFFFVRVDRAGQISKRQAGASGAALVDAEAACPLWPAFDAFAAPGKLCVELVRHAPPDGPERAWLTIARTVAPGSGDARFAVMLGIEARLAGSLAAARGLALDGASAAAIGAGCTACREAHCLHRSLPPRGAALRFDERSRGLSPFAFASEG